MMSLSMITSGTLNCLGQGAQNEQAKNIAPELRKFDKKDWNKLKQENELDQIKDKIKQENKQQANNLSFNMPLFSSAGPVFKIIMYVVFIAILVFIISKLFNFNAFSRSNTKLKKQEYTIEDLEDHLHESDLDRFLREALENNDLRLALRIYYLMIIKELSQLNWILWKKDKTNNEYVYEMRNKEGADTFEHLTLTFERVWYGDLEVNQSFFDSTSIKFKNFIDLIRNKDIEK
ncbi:hypothetical protein QQ008_25385 [Fulvivirgaceae bacterium BMA10]|uniref:Protein-glutamine gamma-glutamyltransferase-like C-terminal domain-containing protein n=1 Tax=Splendidivirga corallicola TaxID=3051826 RepID=A0ABT8KX50_9BACT|nr:hypothetical protein [Fulvivirgaceae bacterium BMA10]